MFTTKKRLRQELAVAEVQLRVLTGDHQQLREEFDWKVDEHIRLHGIANDLQAENDALRAANSELKSKLDRTAEVFGEAFVKGGQLPPAKGPKRPNRQKLSDEEVKDIRRAHRGGMSQRQLAEAYDVNPATISRIVRNIYH